MKESFTLAELLVVISIISILVSLLASTLARAKLAGQKGACQANSRTIESLNLIGVPVIYAQSYEYPFWSPYEGKEGYAEISFPYGRKETVLFVNCFDCHDRNDPFEQVHSLITVY
jgi:prepilin-type N-terminal cleavage/methylation domain-containing protein|tara:strand:+ start:14530 stop:14877 length:348 start_codon:yes stop_codon:yes gene_type:complete